MKSQIIIWVLTALSISSLAQNSFKKGYIINQEKEKIECFILNQNWLYNPDRIKYRLTEDSPIEEMEIDDIRVLELPNRKYVRVNTRIDTTATRFSDLSTSIQPDYLEKTVLLRILIEGRSSLYYYEDRKINQFFYKVGKSSIQPLVYRWYRHPDKGVVENKEYKEQIMSSMDCADITEMDAINTTYEMESLTAYFVKYNTCFGSDFVNYYQKKSSLITLQIRPRLGVNFSSLDVDSRFINALDTKFSNEINFRAGVEFELGLPFYKNKWALTVEPVYQSFAKVNQTDERKFEVNYQSLELYLGLRHYFFLREKNSTIFISAAYIRDFPFNSVFSPEGYADAELNSNPHGLGFGLGYGYKKRLNIEAKYLLNRDIFKLNPSYESKYQSIILILGYNLLNEKN